MLTDPMRATLADFDAIVANANACFPTERDTGGVVPRWPHGYRRDATHLSRYLIIKDGVEVVSAVAYIEQTLQVDGVAIRVAGLGNVATAPAYRGRGLMTQLLKRAIECMHDEGYAFSDLGGDRRRYGNYGWEVAGREWRFTVTRHSFGPPPAPGEFAVAPYTASAEEIQATHDIHEAEPRRVQRSRAQHECLLGRLGKETLLARVNGRVAAYLVAQFDKDGCMVYEQGGDPAAVRFLVGALLDRMNHPVTIPSPWTHPLNQTLREISDGWTVSPTRMFRLLHLRATLEGFAPQMQARCDALALTGQRRITLGIAETGERVSILFSPDTVTVEPANDRDDCLLLPQRQMTMFLFGPMSPSAIAALPPETQFLDSVFPLDFAFARNDYV